MQQLFVFVLLQGEPKRYINFRYCLLSLISPFSVLLDMFSHCATIPIHVVACLYRTRM